MGDGVLPYWHLYSVHPSDSPIRLVRSRHDFRLEEGPAEHDRLRRPTPFAFTGTFRDCWDSYQLRCSTSCSPANDAQLWPIGGSDPLSERLVISWRRMKSDRITRFTPAFTEYCATTRSIRRGFPPRPILAALLIGSLQLSNSISLRLLRNPHVAWTSELRGPPLQVS